MGYGGTIPTKFRELSEKEIEKIKASEEKVTINEIKNLQVIQVTAFKEAVKASLYVGDFESFKSIPDLLERFPQFTPFVIDMLIKHGESIPQGIRDHLADSFSKWLVPEEFLPEYMAISVVKILGNKWFARPEILFKFFRELKRNSGSLIGRATLESLENIIDRGNALEIRRYYDRADLWEKRQIIRKWVCTLLNRPSSVACARGRAKTPDFRH